MALPHSISTILTTPEEYLQLDRHSPVRHEYVDGYAYALAGGSLNHSTICVNLASVLRPLLRGSACRIYNSDARVRLSATRYVYPDLTITCAPEDRGETDILRSPCVIIEVLSPGTEEYDRGDKFAYYRACPTIQEYVLVASEDRAVEVYRRPAQEQAQEATAWTMQPYSPGDEIDLTSVNVRIPLDEIYAEIATL